MFAIPNQSSIPKAYTQFTGESGDNDGRLSSSSNRDRLVDCMEEFVKYTIVMRPHFDLFSDRFSERTAKKQRDRETKVETKTEQKSGDVRNGSGQDTNGVRVDRI